MAAAAALLIGCAASSAATPAAAPEFDRPVPPGEPRAELSLVVDLEAAADCEERFDLALYRDRGVELVRWDDREDACTGRALTVVYLPSRASEQALREAIAKLARAVRPAAPAKAPVERVENEAKEP